MSVEEVGAALVDALLQPMPDAAAPCGPDLEYDNAFLELNQAAAGKPETQWDAGEPPDWRGVRSQAEALLQRSRDLRVAVLWLRAGLHVEGFAALPQGLRLVQGLLEQFWDTLHPLPDPEDGDPYARMNALAVLREADGGLADLRHAVLVRQRGVGEITGRTVEVALGLMPPRADETPLSRAQLEQMLEAALAESPAVRDTIAASVDRVKSLIGLLNERVGIEQAVDLKPFYSALQVVAGALPAAPEVAEEAMADEPAEPGATPTRGTSRGGLSGSVNSREEAVRAIDMVCEYLERAEPTNPAPLLLRRARRLVNRNFLQLMKELAPDALAEVARVMGVDPETVQLDDAG